MEVTVAPRFSGGFVTNVLPLHREGQAAATFSLGISPGQGMKALCQQRWVSHEIAT